jgi:hypothetical protein
MRRCFGSIYGFAPCSVRPCIRAEEIEATYSRYSKPLTTGHTESLYFRPKNFGFGRPPGEPNFVVPANLDMALLNSFNRLRTSRSDL